MQYILSIFQHYKKPMLLDNATIALKAFEWPKYLHIHQLAQASQISGHNINFAE